MLLLAALTLTTTRALAGEAELQACCAAVGAGGCPSKVALVGEGTQVQGGTAGTEVRGAWVLACGGPAAFDAVYRRTLDHTPRQGEVLETLSPVASHCLQQACEVPANGCMQTERDGTLSVLGCQDGMPLSAAALGSTPTRRMKKPVVVVVARRPLVVDAQPPAGAVPPPPPASAPTPGGAVAAPGRTAEALVELTDRFPADPPNPCTPRAQDLRLEGRRHVDLGDEKRIARDWAASVREYRVAITMDVCNGYAWLGVGEVAASNERPDLAAHALLNATQLLPQHYGAFTTLGKAYEALGQVPLAAEAYRTALGISPSLMEARAGLARTAP